MHSPNNGILQVRAFHVHNLVGFSGVSKPDEVTARLVRSYIAELTARGLADTTFHGNARAIRKLVRFWHAEGYLFDAVKFAMPKQIKKRLPVLTAEQVSIIVHACHDPRDKAVILLMVDTGIRLNEAIDVDWCEMDIMTGLARVRRGKGGKARSVVAGATTRRALLAYRHTLQNTTDNAPLIQTREGSRFASHGLHQVFKRMAIVQVCRSLLMRCAAHSLSCR